MKKFGIGCLSVIGGFVLFLVIVSMLGHAIGKPYTEEEKARIFYEKTTLEEFDKMLEEMKE